MAEDTPPDGQPPAPEHRAANGERPRPPLPPPAFPPGRRRVQIRRELARAEDEASGAFISPDDPMPARASGFEDAFISPDEPLPERGTAGNDAYILPDDPIPSRQPRPGVGPADAATGEQGVVTDMGLDPHLDVEELRAGGDPHVVELTERVAKLAEDLRRRGEAGLGVRPGMDRFEATLRAYCVGYLAGRRVLDEQRREEG